MTTTKRVALVTGASSGIGAATARRLAGAGFITYAAARRVAMMEPLREHGVLPVPLDVTDDSSMAALVREIIAENGQIDVLVNNAGYGSYGALEDVPISEARRQFDVNIFGMARLIQLVLPHMRGAGDGYIVNISSVGGKMWEPMGSWYHATKFAVEGLSDSLRAEVASFGIKVVVIEPGAIRTEWASISADNLQAISAGTVYADQAALVGGALRGGYRRTASEPQVVANAIARAVSRSRPRTRYAVGGGARSILMMQRILPDRGFDRFIRLTYAVIGGRPLRSDPGH
jgi:NAD(P)-dependent dehydrogenase (short-subunit alcohol dehydrogenase family)